MSSPPREPVFSSSPTSVGRSSPVLRRASVSPSEIGDSTPRPRLSPTLTRSYDPNDPEARERQRTMDVDMALHLSRARRETVSSPGVVSPYDPAPRETTFPSLSYKEQHDVDIASGSRPAPLELDMGDGADDVTLHTARDPTPEPHLSHLHQHLHQMHDPALLVTPGAGTHSQMELGDPSFGLPTYQANASRSQFDFSHMEEFATAEKTALGITSPTSASGGVAFQVQRHDGGPDDGPSDANINVSQRMRQRKLSQSNAVPRSNRKGIGGRMALFEGNPGEPPPSLPARLGLGGPAQAASNVSSREDMGTSAPQGGNYFSMPAGSPGAGGAGILHTGHDRPYRFSFYSNTLSATIHARSLSELPAEGQTFESLFSGLPSQTSGTASPPSAPTIPGQTQRGGGPSTLIDNLRRTASGPGSKRDEQPGSRNSMASNANLPGGSRGGDQKNGINNGVGIGADYEGNTWWLDVQSPTDEEMKMLSKVFAIHPLTTEDIQMEETREKIELFRNYYLVCFRGFDQDPYSPTHLEPLNMYIIVFREGILSFHFRPTPHPQNVRRRIKHLKDYISVTSDWISYALIDDITDAFGPLIQSIEYEVDSIDELVLILKEAEQSDMLRRIGTCRKKVMGLLRLMGNKADVVKGLAKRCNENWRVAPTSDIGLYLSDIQDHLITMTQNLNHYEKILSRSHSNYLAQISIEMTDANNQINDVLSKLTALGTVLIPMNLVTGLWGMNVHVPGQDVPGYAWFLSIIACLVAFAIVGGYSTYKFMVKR